MDIHAGKPAGCGHFMLSAPLPENVKLFFQCDDGGEIYFSPSPGGFAGAFGHGVCHNLGCVNLPGGCPGL